MSEPFYIDFGATFDATRTYRYGLWREWNPDLRRVGFVMLNPSTADEFVLDPTLRRCLGYAVSWGFGAFEVGNLFALRSTAPAVLYETADPVGPANDAALLSLARRSDLVVCAWGAHGRHLGRAEHVTKLLASVRPLHCLRETKAGEPGHPLYLPGALEPRTWRSMSSGNAGESIPPASPARNRTQLVRPRPR